MLKSIIVSANSSDKFTEEIDKVINNPNLNIKNVDYQFTLTPHQARMYSALIICEIKEPKQ